MIEEKQCRGCGESKPLDAFNRDKSKKDGRHTRCKPCAAAAVAASINRSPEAQEKTKARQAAWHKEHHNADEKRLQMRRLRAKWRSEDPEGYRLKQAGAFQKWAGENRESYLERKRQWVRDHPEKNRDYVHKYRARKVAATIEPVDYAAIAERDQNVCHICGYEVDLTVGVYHPQARAFDHVIPLTRGGDHSMQNIKVAHRLCNARKNNRIWNAANQEGLS